MRKKTTTRRARSTTTKKSGKRINRGAAMSKASGFGGADPFGKA